MTALVQVTHYTVSYTSFFSLNVNYSLTIFQQTQIITFLEPEPQTQELLDLPTNPN